AALLVGSTPATVTNVHNDGSTLVTSLQKARTTHDGRVVPRSHSPRNCRRNGVASACNRAWSPPPSLKRYHVATTSSTTPTATVPQSPISPPRSANATRFRFRCIQHAGYPV